MKIIIVTSEDPFYIPIFFERFYKLFAVRQWDIEITGLVMTEPLGNKTKWGLAIRMLGFYGLWGFVRQSFKYALQKVGKKLYNLGLKSSSFSIEYFTKKSGVDVLAFTDVNTPEFVKYVKDNKIDLITSVASSQIFKNEIIKAPKLGCINIHNAPLPNYRGMLPNFWQMYHGEEYSIMTIHEMVEMLDMGRIILQENTKIQKGMTLDQLIRETKKKNAKALIEVWGMFLKGKVDCKPLADNKGSYFTFPTKKDVADFKKRGYRLF